jgi:peptidoglycan/LPS O-acetylase OafA/YrhL
MRRIGGYSFSLYLLHEPILAGTGYLTSDLLPGSIVIAIGILLSLVVAAISFHWFERPVQDALRAPIAKLVYAIIVRVKLALGWAQPAPAHLVEPAVQVVSTP